MPQFIGITLPAAYAGDLTRGAFDHTVELKMNDKTTPVTAFGVPVKYNAASNGVTPITSSSDAVIGFACRKYGQANMSGVQNENFVSVMRRGYIAVVAPEEETIKSGMQVYMKANGSLTSNKNDGGEVPVSYTALTGATFCGPANAGIVEVAFNI